MQNLLERPAQTNLGRPIIVAGRAGTPVETHHGWEGINLQIFTAFHSHLVAEYPFHVVSLQLKGTRRVFQRRNGMSLDQVTRPGCVIVTPRGEQKEWRTFEDREGCQFAVINLDPRFCDRVLDESGIRCQSSFPFKDEFGTRDFCLEEVIRSLLAEHRASEMASSLYVGLLARQLILQLACHYSRIHDARAQTDRKKAKGIRLERAIEYINANLSNALSLDAIAKHAALSPTHFARAFRNALGVSPHRYVLQRRIERAQFLLKTSDAPISEISYEVGFSNHSHFTKAFQRLTGVTPGRYRTS